MPTDGESFESADINGVLPEKQVMGAEAISGFCQCDNLSTAILANVHILRAILVRQPAVFHPRASGTTELRKSRICCPSFSQGKGVRSPIDCAHVTA